MVILTPAEVLYGPTLNYTESMRIAQNFEDTIFTKRKWCDGQLVLMAPNKDLVEVNEKGERRVLLDSIEFVSFLHL